MKVLLIGDHLDRFSAARLTTLLKWAEENNIYVEFVTQEECEKIKEQEYNFVIFDETAGSTHPRKPVKSKKRPQKPYYRAKERY